MLKEIPGRSGDTAETSPRPMVLVVDDDRGFCESIARCLAARGYDVTCADGGDVAVEAITDRKPDVIVTDVMMPGMDGIDLMNWLRDEGLDIPVIVISGDALSAEDIVLPSTRQDTEGNAAQQAGYVGVQRALVSADRIGGKTTAAWMGASSVLQKPFGRALLEDSVARALTAHTTVH